MLHAPGFFEFILIGIAAEFIALAVWLRAKGRSVWIPPLACFLASGAALMVGLRTALHQDSEWLVLGALQASLVLHIAALVLTAKRLEWL